MVQNLKEQRTEYADLRADALEEAYMRDMALLYDNIAPHLPDEASTVMDVGCGLGGINVLTAARYPTATFMLLDKDGSKGSKIGWHHSADVFGCYNHMEDTVAFLRGRGVKNVLHPCDGVSGSVTVDVVYSFLSWGFHYPLSTYRIKAKTLIVDLRRGKGQPVPARAKLIHKGQKHDRYCVTNFLCA
jgi:hypothetical protein